MSEQEAAENIADARSMSDEEWRDREKWYRNRLVSYSVDEYEAGAIADLIGRLEHGADVLKRARQEADEWKARALEAEDELEAWKDANLKPIEARARLQALEEAAVVAEGHRGFPRSDIAAAIRALKES